ncbi:MAG: hypothetical protein L6R48_02255 [Planctomycetes bacterium]|nr:hypothetical protein [Planctomycetota bacterium]
MHVDGDGNQIEAVLAPGEVLHFTLRYLRGRRFGLNLLPPCPLGSPLARLWHGCYWLGRVAAGEGTSVRLAGPSVTGRFVAVPVPAGEACWVDCRRLAGFVLAPGGFLRTRLAGLLSPTLWLLGHPLPVLVHGPATVLLHGEGLRSAAGGEFLPEQVAAFPAASPFAARALAPDHGWISQLANAFGTRARWVFPADTAVVMEPVNRPHGGGWRLVLHLLLHLACWATLAVLLGG